MTSRYTAGGCEGLGRRLSWTLRAPECSLEPGLRRRVSRLGGAPYVTLRQNGEFVKGEYEIGITCWNINGGANSDFVDFHIQGTTRWKKPSEKAEDGDRMTFELWQYLGDEWTFECERRR